MEGEAVKIDLVVYDFDGVMTDNRVLVREDGKESVFCNRDDGWAIRKIKEQRIPQMILSTEENPVVKFRAKKLSIPCVSGCLNKKNWLISFCEEKRYDLRKVMYVGNGLNDLEIMKCVGHPIAPNDAHPDVKNIVKYITHKKGGEGVLLEVLKYLLQGDTS